MMSVFWVSFDVCSLPVYCLMKWYVQVLCFLDVERQ